MSSQQSAEASWWISEWMLCVRHEGHIELRRLYEKTLCMCPSNKISFTFSWQYIIFNLIVNLVKYIWASLRNPLVF
jgi:hypothetical protein